MNRSDLSEITSWFDSHIEAMAENHNMGSSEEGFLSQEEYNELHRQAVATFTKLNRLCVYFGSRLVELKGDLAEAKIFGSIIQGQYLAERISELEALMEAGTLDTVV